MKNILLTGLSALILATPCLNAGTLPDAMSLKVRAGYNIGGTAPLGLPATIRGIDSFRPCASFMAGADAGFAFKGGFGLQTGLRFENKGMDAGVTTKGYRMEMRKGDSSIEGLFTGHVSQKVTQWMITLPLQATYGIGAVSLKAGPYVSYLVGRNFSGIASDGYIRQGDPTGPKIMIGSKEGEWATYDFSGSVRRLQAGIGIGADWTLCKDFGLSADLTWGLTGLLKSSFKTVEQTLYPIYGTVGVFYQKLF